MSEYGCNCDAQNYGYQIKNLVGFEVNFELSLAKAAFPLATF